MSDTFGFQDEPPPKKKRYTAPDIADEPDEPERWQDKPPKLELMRLAGVALVVAGLVVGVAFAKIGVEVKKAKVFAGLAAGGPVLVVLGVAFIAHPLPLPYLMRFKDFKEPGVKGELFRDLPGVWKVWLGIAAAVAVMSLAGAFLLVAPGRR